MAFFVDSHTVSNQDAVLLLGRCQASIPLAFEIRNVIIELFPQLFVVVPVNSNQLREQTFKLLSLLCHLSIA